MTVSKEPEQILYLDGTLEPAKLASIFGINVSAVYQDHQKGLFGGKPLIQMTYREAIQIYRKNLMHSVELKLAKEETERQVKLKKLEEHTKYKVQKSKVSSGYTGGDGEDSMHPLMAKKVTQDIKLNRVREVQSWLKIAEDKRELLSRGEMATLLEPFIHIIKNVLISISTEFPETQSKIDSCMGNLYSFGERLLRQVGEDENIFVEELLEKDIDDELLELTFLPEIRE